jgi:predicted transcriptional regulator
MSTEKTMRQEVKKYIDTADVNWWDTMPDKILADVETALIESEKGQVIPHTEIKKRYSKWIVK